MIKTTKSTCELFGFEAPSFGKFLRDYSRPYLPLSCDVGSYWQTLEAIGWSQVCANDGACVERIDEDGDMVEELDCSPCESGPAAIQGNLFEVSLWSEVA